MLWTGIMYRLSGVFRCRWLMFFFLSRRWRRCEAKNPRQFDCVGRFTGIASIIRQVAFTPLPDGTLPVLAYWHGSCSDCWARITLAFMSLSNITHLLLKSPITTAASPITVSQSRASASAGSKATRPRVRLLGHKVIVCAIFLNETRPLRRLRMTATYSS